MKIYLVGGAVRDKLMGIPVRDRDWVVTGSTPEEMENRGYKAVGKDFPVFLHPETHEEYALARTEKKSGTGYKGFIFHTAPEISIEEDLERRDLTINAIAEDSNGELIDPFNGKQDIENRILRHVSPAFTEDPLRVIRVARFAARFGFRVADETLEFMKNISVSGELETIAPERIWSELEQALSSRYPTRFILVLRACHALETIFPEIDCLFGIPQTEKYHPEIDTGLHTIMTLNQATRLSEDPQVRFAALVHDLGKGNTPVDQLPRHIGHEGRGVKLVKQLCKRLRIPNQYRDLACLVSKYHLDCHRIIEMRPGTVLKKLESLDAFRRPQRFEQFLLACEADARGRSGLENRAYMQGDYFRRAFKLANSVDTGKFSGDQRSGEEIARAIQGERLAVLETLGSDPV